MKLFSLDNIFSNSKIMNERTIKFFIFLAYGIFFLWKHLPLTYVGDDLIMGPGVDTYTLWENFVWHWESNGRIIIDVFANIWYRIPMICWKVFDTGIYIFVAALVSSIFTKNRWYHVLITCILVLLFPFEYMESAGYIATSANYLYPIFGVLVIVRFIKYLLDKQEIPKLMYLAVAACIIYITNHDQTAVALLAGLLCFLIYCIITKVDKKLLHHVIGLFSASTLTYITYFIVVPGHLNRMQSTAELDYWFPEYANWTFFDKVFHGYTSTVANAFFGNVTLVTLFTALLLIISLRQKEPFKIFVGCIPFAGIALARFMGIYQFIYYFERSYFMPELTPIETWAFPFILSVVILVCIFLAIWFNIEKLENKLLLTLLLILAAGTREMMGFSATIYASSYRTFTFFLYAILFCCVIILRDLEEDDKNKHLWYMGIGAIVTLIAF